jgi:deoxyribonuclease V
MRIMMWKYGGWKETTVMEIERLHSWDVSADEAVAIQQRLRALVVRENGFDPAQVRTIAGVDASYRDKAYAAIVVLALPDLHVVEQAIAERETPFPYVPGLLSFREAPAVLDAMEKLKARPDLLMFDGQGIAHPRRLGIAAHMGVYLGMPSIGCAKSRLIGSYTEPGPNAGDLSPLMAGREQVGVVLRSKPRTNPLFISIGHLIDLPTATSFVLQTLHGYRLPEPTRQADRLAGVR